MGQDARIRLTILDDDFDRTKHGKRTVLVLCDCGNLKEVIRSNIASGATTSCGCVHREQAALAFIGSIGNYRHGGCGSRAYNSWTNMHQRCSNPNHPKFKDYGARGITVCSRWSSFEAFHSDMGDPPVGMTLDRRKVNGNYTRRNCRWATYLQQANNKRKT